MTRHTPDHITTLSDHEIFVFGSNLKGHHAGGAAGYASQRFGAEWGIPEGLTGWCYAYPTLNTNGTKRSGAALTLSRDKLYATARALPEYTFLLTKVGCGIAGYPEEYMRELFTAPPVNVITPEGWHKHA